jgi:hypothetical protein
MHTATGKVDGMTTDPVMEAALEELDAVLMATRDRTQTKADSMNLEITINLDGAAFTDETGALDGYAARIEVMKITGAIAARIEEGERKATCHDSNGNRCGEWSI